MTPPMIILPSESTDGYQFDIDLQPQITQLERRLRYLQASNAALQGDVGRLRHEVERRERKMVAPSQR